jgi:hypothetical protein
MNPQILTPHIPAYFPVRIPSASVARYNRFEVRLAAPGSADGCCARLVVDACRHTVAPGESLSTIAQQANIDVATLKLFNQLAGANPVIRPGQKLLTCDVPLSRLALDPDLW